MITAFTRLPSYRYSSFTLQAYLCWMHTYCQWPIIQRTRTRKERAQARTKWPLATWSRFIRIRVFRGVKKWPTCHVAVPTGSALASQRSIFRENRLKFRPQSAAEKVSIVYCTNNHVKSEMLSNRHTHRPSTVTLAAHARRGLITYC